MGTEVSTIPRIIQVIYDIKANFPASAGLYDLAFATDENVLYYWNGTAWISIAITLGAGHHFIFPPCYNAIVQGTWIDIIQPLQYTSYEWADSSTNNADEINYKVSLEAGTYTILVLGIAWNAAGKSDIKIDTTVVATFDWYAAALTYNVYKAQTGITVSSPGLKTITVKVNGKNAASTDYGIAYTFIAILRTA